MLPDNDLVITAIVLTLIMMVLVSFYILLIVNAQNRKLRFQSEKQELQQLTAIEVSKAEKEATQATMAHIGRELHDNVGQLLAATQIGMMNHFGEALDTNPELHRIASTLDASIDEVSRLGRALNNDFWRNRDLFAAILEEAVRIEQLGGIKVNVAHDDANDALNHNERVMLFRVFQEIMSNALKYSSAQTIDIRLKSAPLNIEIHDNGKGFNPEIASTGSGLKNIHHRCQLIGVSAELISSPGKGTHWKLTRAL
jgi:signal transduction histidine kinase